MPYNTSISFSETEDSDLIDELYQPGVNKSRELKTGYRFWLKYRKIQDIERLLEMGDDIREALKLLRVGVVIRDGGDDGQEPIDNQIDVGDIMEQMDALQ